MINYKQHVREGKWVTIYAEIIISNILLIKKLSEDNRNVDWVNAWNITPPKLRSKPKLNLPYSRLKTFDLLWPIPILNYLNCRQHLDLYIPLSRTILLKQTVFINDMSNNFENLL